MKVLVACEESQEVCKAFRAKGHEAYSCDIQDCSGGHPEWHIKSDVLKIIYDHWDMIIAHPPCTYLCVSGNRWFNIDRYGNAAIERLKKREEAFNFFLEFTKLECEKVAIENPIGYVNTHFRKPSQIIHPYFFGDPVRKATCLWLKNLQPLQPTNIVPFTVEKYGCSGPAYYAMKDGKILSWNDPMTKKIRSKTFPGIAKAMADQWG